MKSLSQSAPVRCRARQRQLGRSSCRKSSHASRPLSIYAFSFHALLDSIIVIELTVFWCYKYVCVLENGHVSLNVTFIVILVFWQAQQGSTIGYHWKGLCHPCGFQGCNERTDNSQAGRWQDTTVEPTHTYGFLGGSGRHRLVNSEFGCLKGESGK